MNKLISLAAGLSVAVVTAFAQQPSAPSGNVEHGKNLFENVGCYQCHGLAGQGAQATGPRIARTQFPFAAFLAVLRHPTRQMPPYEAVVLSDQDAADIYAYLQTMPAPRDPKTIPLLKAER